MKIVFLDVKTIGEDIDLSYFDEGKRNAAAYVEYMQELTGQQYNCIIRGYKYGFFILSKANR